MQTWIFNVPTDVTQFMLFEKPISLYLPVEKMADHILPGAFAVIWGGSAAGKRGLIGWGVVVTPPLKPGGIAQKNRKLFDANKLQLGINLNYLSRDAFVPATYARQLPSLNEHKQPVMIGTNAVYYGYSILEEFLFFLKEYRHLYDDILCYSSDEKPFDFGLHILRERYLASRYYSGYKKRLLSLPPVCAHCSTDFARMLGREQAMRIMELHETIPSFNERYRKIDPDNFVAVCPTCHKLAHDKMRQVRT